MQFNRKYYLMLLLLSILLALAIQGDSEIMNHNKNIELINPDNKNNTLVTIEMPEMRTINWSREEQKTEDTFITESKSRIINKETILGY